MAINFQPVAKKRRYQNIEVQPFPMNYNFIGYFTGLDVEVFDENAIKILTNCGCFGENPRPRQMLITEKIDKIAKVSKDEYFQKLKWREKYGESCENEKKMILVYDKEKEDEQLVEDPYVIPNSKVLSPEEVIFLHKELNCLEVRNTEDQPMTIENLWKEFCDINENFPVYYAAYLYLKSKNWVVKSGSKFGGQFLLYKQGPKFYHASYIVKLVIKNQRTMQEHQSNERIAENTKKSVIYLEVDYPTDLDLTVLYENLDKFTVKEVAFHRFIVKKLTQ